MELKHYKEFAKEILQEKFDRTTAIHGYIRLMEIYVQDGALAGEKFYGNKMIAKGKVLLGLQGHLNRFT